MDNLNERRAEFIYNGARLAAIAAKAPISAIAIHKGIALRYMENYAFNVPLLLKLNGKTNIPEEKEPYSAFTATVEDAVQMGADAVGVTLYVGSPIEHKIYEVFRDVEAEARDYGMPLVVWAYARGPYVKERASQKMVAYATRVAFEIGADMVKVYYTGDAETFKWVVNSAGNMPVLVAGGTKKEGRAFFQDVHDIMTAGAKGMAVGRNIWQHKYPVEMAQATCKMIYDGISVDEAMKMVPKEE